MTNEQAIKSLENHKRWFQDEFVIYCDALDALDMAIEALQAQQWIPCSERLPEEHIGLLGYIDADGNVHAYNELDIIVRCKTQEEHDEAHRRLMGDATDET